MKKNEIISVKFIVNKWKINLVLITVYLIINSGVGHKS